MGIDVAWVDEDHNEIQLVSDPRKLITGLVNSRWSGLTNSVCLRFVNPWGDAVFNQAQNQLLLNELSTEARETSDSEVRAHLQNVIKLVELASNETHTYVKFIGD